MMNRKEYIRNYQRKWIRARRTKWIMENGPCKTCGSNEDLQVDHINPNEKEFNVQYLWSRVKKIRDKELLKCQVLCSKCHLVKTKKDLSSLASGPKPQRRKYTKQQYFHALDLFYKQKISARKIASMLQIPRGTVSVWMYRDDYSDWIKEYNSEIA